MLASVGLTKADAVVLALVLQNRNTVGGDVLCIGAPETHFSWEWIQESLFPWLAKTTQPIYWSFSLPIQPKSKLSKNVPFKEFFLILGIENVKVLDLDGYEGADYLFDLNESECPSNLRSKFDLIVDGGSLEHCFNLPNALNSLNLMLRNDGIIFHSNPANKMLDHGFYQISPTLYSDYYQAAGFDLLYGGLSDTQTKLLTYVKIEKYTADLYRSNGGRRHASNLPRMYVLFAVRKTSHSIMPNSVIQNYYQKMHSDDYPKNPSINYHISAGDIKIRRKIIPTFRAAVKFFKI